MNISKCVPMLAVPDMEATLAWYVALGFTELSRFDDCGELNFAMVGLGGAELMLVPKLFQGNEGRVGPHDASLWLYTSEVDDVYAAFRALSPPLDFVEELYDTFYGAREFGIRDLNGYVLYFIQSPIPAI